MLVRMKMETSSSMQRIRSHEDEARRVKMAKFKARRKVMVSSNSNSIIPYRPVYCVWARTDH